MRCFVPSSMMFVMYWCSSFFSPSRSSCSATLPAPQKNNYQPNKLQGGSQPVAIGVLTPVI